MFDSYAIVFVQGKLVLSVGVMNSCLCGNFNRDVNKNGRSKWIFENQSTAVSLLVNGE